MFSDAPPDVAYLLIFYALLHVVLISMFCFDKDCASKRTRKEPPGPKPTDAEHGNLQEIKEAGGLHGYLKILHDKYGPITTFWIGKQKMVSIASLEMFKQHQHIFDRPVSLFEGQVELIGKNSIQVTNGEHGKKLHRTLSRPFAFSECKKYYKDLIEISKDLLQKIENNAVATHIPIFEYMTITAIKGICQTAFGYKLDDKSALEFNENYNTAWEKTETVFAKERTVPLDEEKIKKAINDFRAFSKMLLENRLKTRHLDDSGEIFADFLLQYGMTNEQEIDNAVTFITGGFHTTGTLLTWILYYIALNQDVQDKLYKELVDVLQDKEISVDTFSNLRYMQSTIDETLRHSCLAPYAARNTEINTEMGNYLVTANTPVIHALGVVLKSEKYYPDPEKFDPDRFSPENPKARLALTFSPFGFAGKRICPGYRFAYVEVTIILSILLKSFKFHLVEGQDIKQDHGLVTKPSGEIWMTVEPRKEPSQL